MAEKLLKYYKYIFDLNGIEGRIELAKRTKLPTPKAAMALDSEANIKKFREVIEEITGKEAPIF